MYMKLLSFKLLLIGGEVVEEGDWEKERLVFGFVEILAKFANLERFSGQSQKTPRQLQIILGLSFVDSTTEIMLKDTVDGGGGHVEFVKCECCRLTEECTPAYIATVRESNRGRWICGLCVEAVKEEMERSCSESEEEALDRHMRFCKSFQSTMSSPAKNPSEDLISAVKQLLIKSLDSPRSPVSSSGQLENSDCRRLSSSSSPTSSIVESNACRCWK